MEVKKSPEADLEQYRTTWLLAGLVVALSVLFVAFEWTGRTEEPELETLLSDLVFEEELEVPLVEQPEVLPPPPPVAPAAPEVVTVAENDAGVEEPPTEALEQMDAASAVPSVSVESGKSVPEEKKGLVIVD